MTTIRGFDTWSIVVIPFPPSGFPGVAGSSPDPSRPTTLASLAERG
jgi:hypothetical protein